MHGDQLDVGSSPQELIENTFFGLRLVSPALERSVVDYVLTGDPHSLPTVSDATRSEVAAVFPALGHGHRHPSADHSERWKGIRPGWYFQHSQESRRRLYVNLGAIDRADDMMLVRLGRALAAFEAPRSWMPSGAPLSVLTLLWDAIHLGGPHQPDTLASFTIERLRSLTRLEGVSERDVDRVLLTTLINRRGDQHHGSLRDLGLLPGVAAFAEAHLAELREAMVEFEPAGAMELLTHAAGRQGLALGIVDWMVAQLDAPYEDMRVISQSAIRIVPPAVALPQLERAAVKASAGDLGIFVAAIETSSDPALAVQALERIRMTRGTKDKSLEMSIERTTIFAMAPLTAGASVVEFVTVPPLVPAPETPLGEDWIAAALPLVDQAISRLEAQLERELRYESAKPGTRNVSYFEDAAADLRLARGSLGALAGYLSGDAPHPGERIARSVQGHVPASALGLSPAQRVRLAVFPGGRAGLHRVGRGDDPRATVSELERLGFSRKASVDAISRLVLPGWGGSATAPAVAWPFMMENPEVFDAALGIRAGDPYAQPQEKEAVLAILEAGPVLPRRYLPFVAAIATGTAKTLRPAAQRVLEKHGVAHSLSEFALRDGAVEARRGAVEWVSRLGGEWASGLLRIALSVEANEVVRASILTAVEALGDDISAYLTPEALLAEAEIGLSKKPPASLAWFPFDSLPECRYARTGEPVPTDVLRWWVILSARLKDPHGAGLLPRYVSQLEPSSREDLGGFLLSAWLTRDLTPLGDDEIMIRAMAEVSRKWASIRRMLQSNDESVVDMFDAGDDLDSARQRVRQAVPSAIADKGILALCGGAPGPELARIARDYMRAHHLKRAQIEALLHVLALSDDPAPLQVVLATARRHRTPSVQEAARTLVEFVGERTGWSVDELADRMVPTGGLDDRAEVEVSYGERSFTLRLTPALALELVAADGSIVRALPAQRAADDPAEVTAAKATLKATRSDVGAVLAAQRSRLYEGMCVQRAWTARDFSEFVLSHPVMVRLAAQLVWRIESSAGAEYARPRLDGVLADERGVEVALTDDAVVRIAHGSIMDAALATAWRLRVEDDGQQFADQFSATTPAIADGQTELADHDGVETETFRLRTRATARGYAHGQTGDGASFEDYVKRFDSVGLVARVSFSGSSLPEESMPVTMGALTVHRSTGTALGAEIELSTIPPVLLAELASDYAHMAQPL